LDDNDDRSLIGLNVKFETLKMLVQKIKVYLGVIVGRYGYMNNKWNRTFEGFKQRTISWKDLNA
jgi:hypothetical protein